MSGNIRSAFMNKVRTCQVCQAGLFRVLILQCLKSEDGNQHQDAGQLSVEKSEDVNQHQDAGQLSMEAVRRDALSRKQEGCWELTGSPITAALQGSTQLSWTGQPSQAACWVTHLSPECTAVTIHPRKDNGA